MKMDYIGALVRRSEKDEPRWEKRGYHPAEINYDNLKVPEHIGTSGDGRYVVVYDPDESQFYLYDVTPQLSASDKPGIALKGALSDIIKELASKKEVSEEEVKLKLHLNQIQEEAKLDNVEYKTGKNGKTLREILDEEGVSPDEEAEEPESSYNSGDDAQAEGEGEEGEGG